MVLLSHHALTEEMIEIRERNGKINISNTHGCRLALLREKKIVMGNKGKIDGRIKKSNNEIKKKKRMEKGKRKGRKEKNKITKG